MKITVDENRNMELREVFLPLVLVTADGERFSIYMRDSGFEFKYQDEWYFAKEGQLEPFKKSVRGNYLIEQKHLEDYEVTDMESVMKYPVSPEECFPIEDKNVLKNSKEWRKEFKELTILDPDGWDRKNFEESWNEPITLEEFKRRVMLSTCSWNDFKRKQ